MYPEKKDRNETANRVFFGTGGFFAVFLVIAMILYVLYDLYVQ
ncbi:hypothetical protein [Exiguobacterium sp. s193]|nr:hypothetical protein [Exiguobacterium sp. s193]